MTSQVDIVNQALAQIGARSQISSLDEDSPEANTASLFYRPKIEALLRAANWNCARFQVQLSLLKAAAGTAENPDGTTMAVPPQPWAYEYAYPSDCVRLRFILPFVQAQGILPPFTTADTVDNTTPWGPPVKFVVGTDLNTQTPPVRIRCIFTNQNQAIAVYTGWLDNPMLWDPAFVSAAVATLAAFFVPALARNQSLMDSSIKMAEAIINQARISDGDEGMTTQDHTPDWIRVRVGGGNNQYSYWQGWDQIAWPNGAWF